MDLAAIRAHVTALQVEIAGLRAENERYLSKHIHSTMEAHAQRQRELRLQQILDELSQLTKTKIL